MNSMLMIFLCNRCRCLLRLVLLWLWLLDRSFSIDRLGGAVIKSEATLNATHKGRLVVHKDSLYVFSIEYLAFQVNILDSVRTGFLHIGSKLHTQLGKLFDKLLVVILVGDVTVSLILVERLWIVLLVISLIGIFIL